MKNKRKATSRQRLNIKERRSEGASMPSLADDFNLSLSTIHAIIQKGVGDHWKQKLLEACEILVSDGDLHSKLEQAAVLIAQVPIADVNLDCHEWLRTVRRHGSIKDTIHRLDLRDCEHLAKQIPKWLFRLT